MILSNPVGEVMKKETDLTDEVAEVAADVAVEEIEITAENSKEEIEEDSVILIEAQPG